MTTKARSIGDLQVNIVIAILSNYMNGSIFKHTNFMNSKQFKMNHLVKITEIKNAIHVNCFTVCSYTATYNI